MENVVSTELNDPNRPADAIIEVRDDGSARRNDGMELQAANKNPWYVLATVFGEQAEDGWPFDHNEELAAKNRRVWNGWFCSGLNEAECKDRAEKAGLDVDDLKPLTKAELDQVRKSFKKHKLSALKLPDQAEIIDFSKTYFPNYVCFHKYILGSHVDLESAWFNENANFGSAMFGGKAVFNSVVFNGMVNFRSTNFSDGAYFHSTRFSGLASFDFAVFSESAVFNSAKFKSITRFDYAKFISTVPLFNGAELYDDTTFTLPDDYRDNWPPLSGKVTVAGQDEPIKVMPAVDQKRAYNRLRLFMHDALQVDEEQFFHRQEMRCKKELADKPHKVIYALFEEISDYGNSIFRPIEWLFYLWIWGAVANLKAVGDGSMVPDYHSIPHALGWSLANLFTVFGFWRLYFEEFKELNAVLQVIGGVQTVSGFALLFLLGLGLRNRFRLR